MQLVLFVALLVASCCFAVLPNQPPGPNGFAGRVVTPNLAWSFRQSDCLGGTISQDVGSTVLSLTRDATFTTCPARTNAGVSYPAASVGVAIPSTSTDQRNVVKTGAFGTSTLPWMDGLATQQSLTIEVWVTAQAQPPLDVVTYLVEIGGESGNVSSMGTTTNNAQLRFSVTRTSATDATAYLEYSFQDASNLLKPELISFTCTGFPALVSQMFDSANLGKLYYLAVTADGTTNANSAVMYFGQKGASLTSCTRNTNDHPIRDFNFLSSSVMRVGSTRSPSPGSRAGFPGEIHFLALYNTALSSGAIAALQNKGLPNSNPAVRDGDSSSLFFVVDEDQPNSVPWGSLLSANVSFIDVDGNTVTGLQLTSAVIPNANPANCSNALVPNPAACSGTLRVGSTVLSENDVITSSATFTFTQSVADTFTTNNPRCDNLAVASPYATFTYKVTDGMGDGSQTCTLNSALPESCKSANVGTIKICVRETNDAPEVVDGGVTKKVLAERSTPGAIVIKCKDRDSDLNLFGLKQVRLLNQSRPDLGYIYVGLNGACTGGSQATFSPSTTVPISAASNVNNVTTLCYVTNPTLLQQTIIGNDRIYYQCEDMFNAAAVSYVDMDIRNALLAGCGVGENADLTKCRTYGKEDYPLQVSLNGFDAVASHNNNSRRLFRIDTVPSLGTLYDARYAVVDFNASLPLGFQVIGTPLTIGSLIVSDNSTGVGLGNLIYVPLLNYFNGLCALNRDPTLPITPGSCPPPGGSTFDRGYFVDGKGIGFNGCNNTAGCPMTFSFSLGYDQDGEGPIPAVFSPSLEDGAEIMIFGVNDLFSSWNGPIAGTLPVRGREYALSSFVSNATGTPLSFLYEDPDGDTYRIGFIITPPFSVSLKLPSLFTTSPATLNNRATFFIGFDCFDNGCNSRAIGGRAYKSDLNALLNAFTMLTTSSSGNFSLTVEIFDPVNVPGTTDQSSNIFGVNSTIFHEMVVTFGVARTSGSGSDAITGGIWAGIAAGGLFILMSCLACISCLFGRARKGGAAAVWVVKNVLCTDVTHTDTDKAMNSQVTGGRKSLEQAIHAQHMRQARVICCALFLKRVCPCFIKFDEDRVRSLPDEEQMLKRALDEEAGRIASRHVPKEDLRMIGVDFDGDGKVDMIISEAPLVDDSIFDWERHLDAKSGRVFYYNVKTNESRWTPPTVKVQEQHKIADRVSVKATPGLFQPRPPERPKAKTDEKGDPDEERTKKD